MRTGSGLDLDSLLNIHAVGAHTLVTEYVYWFMLYIWNAILLGNCVIWSREQQKWHFLVLSVRNVFFFRKNKFTESTINSSLFPKSVFEFYHQSQYLNTSADIYTMGISNRYPRCFLYCTIIFMIALSNPLCRDCTIGHWEVCMIKFVLISYENACNQKVLNRALHSNNNHEKYIFRIISRGMHIIYFNCDSLINLICTTWVRYFR